MIEVCKRTKLRKKSKPVNRTDGDEHKVKVRKQRRKSKTTTEKINNLMPTSEQSLILVLRWQVQK